MKFTKHWPHLLILLIVVISVVYYLFDSGSLGLPALPAFHGWWGNKNSQSDAGNLSSAQIAGQEISGQEISGQQISGQQISWQLVNRPADGFRVQMPSGARDLQAPAMNESGGTEPVKMLQSSPGGDSSYAITWADDPPVARVNNGNADRTLDQARDGMLASTESTLASETKITVGSYPGIEILAHNTAGGVLNARLIFVAGSAGSKPRLYTLMALFPTAGARNAQDVSRFFNSFAITGTPGQKN